MKVDSSLLYEHSVESDSVYFASVDANDCRLTLLSAFVQ